MNLLNFSLKVENEDTFQRVGGTALGGGTFLGLSCLLTNCDSFDEVMELANRVCDHSKGLK